MAPSPQVYEEIYGLFVFGVGDTREPPLSDLIETDSIHGQASCLPPNALASDASDNPRASEQKQTFLFRGKHVQHRPSSRQKLILFRIEDGN